MEAFPALRRAARAGSWLQGCPSEAPAPRVRSNPSLERRPSEAGRLGPGGVRLRNIVAARPKPPCLSGPPQLER